MSDLFGVEVPEVTGLHNLLTLACETASLVGDTGLFPKLSALLTMAAWNKDRSEGLERGEIERMMYYAKPEETDVTGDVEAFLTKNDADGNKVVNTSELEIAVQTRDRLECELRDGIRARHTASRSEEERVARGCEKAKMKSELRPLNFCGASATATVKARRYAPFALRALAQPRARAILLPLRGVAIISGVGLRAARGWWLGSLLQLGTRQIGRGGARARTRGAKPTEQGARGRRGVRTRG